MRIWPRLGSGRTLYGSGSRRAWFSESRPVIGANDVRPLIMILGIWLGFLVAIHYAGSPKMYAAVDRVNHFLNPYFSPRPAVASQEDEALIVTAQRSTELTAVATLSPRGFHPVIANTTADALKVLQDGARRWKLAVIDGSTPGSAQVAGLLKESLPGTTVVNLNGHEHAQSVSRALLERVE